MRVRTLNAKDFKCEAFRVPERGRQQRKIMDAMKEEIQRVGLTEEDVRLEG